MRLGTVLGLGVAVVAVTAAIAQTEIEPGAPQTEAAPVAAAPGSPVQAPAVAPAAIAEPVAAPVEPPPPPGPPKNAVLQIKALDKITGRAVVLAAPLNKPVKFATLTITARTCYSTPPSETPETSAFLQIDDDPPDHSHIRRFSGWMYASSPGLNSLQHPLYDVWVISCSAKSPGQASPAAAAPVRPVSPNAGANEAMPVLPEDAGQ